jgi:hypothetical protein
VSRQTAKATRRTRREYALHLESSPDQSRPLAQTQQPEPLGGGAGIKSAAVVADDQLDVAGVGADAHGDRTGARMLGDVGERLLN